MRFAEVEGVEKRGNDFVLDINIGPNRASDCFSHFGIAREIAAHIGAIAEIPDFRPNAGNKKKTKDFVSVELKDKNECSRYVAKAIVGVRVGPSPKWLKDKLEICGLNSINNVVDAANYVMLETGQPLHAFDFKKLAVSGKSERAGKQKALIVRRARSGEKITTLDKEKYELNNDILIIADSDGPLAIAGIKGGQKAEIGNDTEIIILESANFNPIAVRRAARILGFKTDASLRFEHGLDPNLAEFAIERTARLIGEIAGNVSSCGELDVYPKKVLPKKIILKADYAEKLLSVKISAREIKRILTNLGFKIIGEQSSQLIVEVPTFRQDVSLAEDLVEEIGRIYGYEKIPSIFPLAFLIPPKRNSRVFWEDNIKNIFKELNFAESRNYSFFSEDEANFFGYKKNKLIELENPLSKEQKYLRAGLIPGLVKNIKKNYGHCGVFGIFELGNIFTSPGKEESALAGILRGEAFYKVKGVIDLLLSKLGISGAWYNECGLESQNGNCWSHPKRRAEIMVGRTRIGLIGEVSPCVLEKLQVGERLTCFEISFDILARLASWEHEYRPISKFPAAIRDIALLVPAKVKVADVLNKINAAGGSLVRDADLFDVYEGEKIPSGKKNFAFHIVYQAADRTLKSEEIDKIHQRIIKALKEDPRWEVRC